jgi:hypothetical protein
MFKKLICKFFRVKYVRGPSIVHNWQIAHNLYFTSIDSNLMERTARLGATHETIYNKVVQ